MSKYDRTVATINATRALEEMEQQVKDVENSRLTEEEKQKALKSHNKMIKIITLFVVFLCVCMVIFMAIGFSISAEMGMIFGVTSMVVMPVIAIMFVIFVKKKRLFSNWVNAYQKVDLGFDGLTEEEINRLKPQDNEKKIIEYCNKQCWKNLIIFLIAIAIENFIFIKMDIPFYSPMPIIITIVIIIALYIKVDPYQVEVHRIKSGFYKKDFGYLCKNCKSEVKIKFEEIEKYESLPRNEDGIRVMPCPKCNNLVPFYNFDTNLEDYKKYLDKINK